ncbi:unnamed protein product [Nezara viridula]|uniref:Thioredoxin domain-containing protein n=1 Tax=Nezara viridula TaxID=85310 RepID=A0A9P0HER0_NEZVI|nr:unnamed protein product [Nezara viridula]
MSHYISDVGVFNIKLTLIGQGLTVVHFFARWSVPCNYMHPIYEELAHTYSKHSFLRVDIDACEELARRYQISIVPTFVFIVEEKKYEVVIGANHALLNEILLGFEAVNHN